MIDLVVHHANQQIATIRTIQNVLTVRVRSLSLLIHHFVVLKQILALVEVAFFNLF